MDLKKWLSGEKGRVALMARHFCVTQSAVTQWADNGVPKGRMAKIREFTGQAVDWEDMVPGAKTPKRRKAEAV